MLWIFILNMGLPKSCQVHVNFQGGMGTETLPSLFVRLHAPPRVPIHCKGCQFCCPHKLLDAYLLSCTWPICDFFVPSQITTAQLNILSVAWQCQNTWVKALCDFSKVSIPPGMVLSGHRNKQCKTTDILSKFSFYSTRQLC